MVVFVLLSSEYPIVLTGWDEQTAALAERVNGDDTPLPFAGLLTTTLAAAGIDRVAIRGRERGISLVIMMKYLECLELIGSVSAFRTYTFCSAAPSS
jgi:hypothetical protein